MSKVIVIGGGPAGMMCAISRATDGDDVILIEKNEKLGKKLYITGKGRCNVTNDCDNEEFLSNVVTNPKFLFGAINAFSAEDTLEFLKNNGLQVKTERGNRVFPLSDKSSDVIKCFSKALQNAGVDVHLLEESRSLMVENGEIKGVITDKSKYFADKVVVCTGGISYSSTGSTGDGYKFAENAGHNVIPPKPALVGVNIKGDMCARLSGVTLKNVRLTAYVGEKEVYSGFGEMLFTHFGISGPIVLSASSVINKYNINDVKLILDLKPALTDEVLEERILRDFNEYKNKALKNSLDKLLPKSLISEIIKISGINPEKKNNSVSIEERKRLINALKRINLIPVSLRNVEEAIVTSGGVSVKEISPKNMQSKLIKGLYFAGEVIDVDAFTGGFNIQIALSTGYIAGKD